MLKFRNYPVIAALLSALLLAVDSILKLFGISIDTDYISKIIEVILAVFALVGVVINPTHTNQELKDLVISFIKSIKNQKVADVVSKAEEIAPKVEVIVDKVTPIAEIVSPENTEKIEVLHNEIDSELETISK